MNESNADYTPKRFNNAAKRNSFLAPEKPLLNVEEENEVVVTQEQDSTDTLDTNVEVQAIEEQPEQSEQPGQPEEEFQVVSKRKKKRNKKKNNQSN